MKHVLVRNVDDRTLSRLKDRARRSGRSLQAELTDVLEQAVRVDMRRFRTIAARVRRLLVGRRHSDSGRLQSEDRSR